MKPRLSSWIFLVVLISMLGFLTSPASARLYPPCRTITYILDDSNSPPQWIQYWVTDPLTGETRFGNWVVSQNGYIVPTSVHAEGGILTWIAWNGILEVHYRIYDPGRGVWKGDHWSAPSPDYDPQLSMDQLQVKDGVVAWRLWNRDFNPESNLALELWDVLYATYDPQFGSWSQSERAWLVPFGAPYGAQYGPGDLQVKNGVVAWPMNYNAPQSLGELDVWCAVYDQELHQWQSHVEHHKFGSGFFAFVFNSIQIPSDTAQVQISFSKPGWEDVNFFYSYNPYNHSWNSGDSLWRRAFCVAQPAKGVVPFDAWLWDCSTALDGSPNHSMWNWQVLENTKSGRTTFFHFTSSGEYTVTEKVWYNADVSIDPITATAGITAYDPFMRESGIFINNGTAYTSSTNVTLGLTGRPGAGDTEMCFREIPGWAFWGNWEPIAATKAWQLSTIYLMPGTPDGPHTVYVKFRGPLGESPEYQATINLVTIPPRGQVIINNGALFTSSCNLQVDWSATSPWGMYMSYAVVNEEDTDYNWTPWELYQPASMAMSCSAKPGRKRAMVRFMDDAGNITHTEASISLKPAVLPFLPLLLGD